MKPPKEPAPEIKESTPETLMYSEAADTSREPVAPAEFEDAIPPKTTTTILCKAVVMPKTTGAMKTAIVFIMEVMSCTKVERSLLTFSELDNCRESEIKVRAATFTPNCTESTKIFIELRMTLEGLNLIAP